MNLYKYPFKLKKSKKNKKFKTVATLSGGEVSIGGGSGLSSYAKTLLGWFGHPKTLEVGCQTALGDLEVAQPPMNLRVARPPLSNFRVAKSPLGWLSHTRNPVRVAWPPPSGLGVAEPPIGGGQATLEIAWGWLSHPKAI